MRIPEAAKELERSEHTIRNWIADGLLPARKIGRFWEIYDDAVQKIKQDGLELKRQNE
jgi:excisionase family DNA binding protein